MNDKQTLHKYPFIHWITCVIIVCAMPQIVSWTGSFHSANVCWLSDTIDYLTNWYHYWISRKYDYHRLSSPPMGPNKYISYLSVHACDLDSYPGHQEILNLHVTCSEAMGHLLPHTDHVCRIMISWGRDSNHWTMGLAWVLIKPTHTGCRYHIASWVAWLCYWVGGILRENWGGWHSTVVMGNTWKTPRSYSLPSGTECFHYFSSEHKPITECWLNASPALGWHLPTSPVNNCFQFNLNIIRKKK